MASSFAASRVQLVYALCLPLAVLLGYFLADPSDFGSIMLVSLVIFALSVPVLMNYYHPLLILAWNAAITPYFLPGSPYLWMLLALVGFLFAVFNRFTNPNVRWPPLPSVNQSMLFLAGAVLFTAWARGGMGIRALGSAQYGGKGYYYVLAAIAGYFALTSQRIPRERAPLWTALFFLSGVTALVPNLAYLGGTSLEFLFYIFPPQFAIEQAMGDYALGQQITRIAGITLSSLAVLCWLLSRHGLGDCFLARKPWRVALLLAALAGSLFSGFRSVFIMFILILFFQALFERMLRPKLILGVGVVVLLLGAVVLTNAQKLPFVVQRTISFLPADISPVARLSAEGSSNWRFAMWRDLLPEIPRYLLLGKGYSIDPTEMAFSEENTIRGFGSIYGGAIVAGNYHSGPLTLVIPFGIWGTAAFVWFIIAGGRYLYRNYRRSPPELLRVNTFLLAYFLARIILFVLVFGSFSTDLFLFTGVIGLSVSINGTDAYESPEAAAEVSATPYRSDLAPVHN